MHFDEGRKISQRLIDVQGEEIGKDENVPVESADIVFNDGCSALK